MARTRIPANELAASAARKFLRAVLTERTALLFLGAPAISDRLVDDAVLLVSELVTSAVTHAGSEVEVACRLDAGGSPADSTQGEAGLAGVVVEVSECGPSDSRCSGKGEQGHVRGYGRQLMRTLAESWGTNYRRTGKTAWFRLECAVATPLATTEQGVADSLTETVRRPPAPEPVLPHDRRGRSAGWAEREGQSFLAEAGELLAGQLDDDMVAALAGQLLVPRLADWCGVWLTTDNAEMRLSHVWHKDERQIRTLRLALEKDRPSARLSTTGVPWPWPECGGAENTGGSALAFTLVSGGRCQGTLLIGQAGLPQLTDAVVRLAEDVARRVAQAVVIARHYTRQASISRMLQRRQLPPSLATIPGIDTAIVYEPCGEDQTVGGDFYDLFPMGDRRWCFLLGDVCGHDLEAMSVTGLARHLVRLLAREGHGIEYLLNRLNLAMAEEAAEAVAFRGEREGSRFLSLLYGELEPDLVTGGARCMIASAGHPPPLRLSTDGAVTPAADSQMLLGIDEHAQFHANSFTLAPGETLLCVTDGVTERRRGTRQLDDDDGLANVLRGCLGLGAKAVAERVRRAAHDFSTEPIDDDLAVLVLEAAPVLGTTRATRRREPLG
ncbi:SpoIIE family protein phosphatase [Streptomyces sp. NPDC054834]